MPPPAVPRATYRLQLRAGFGFAEVEALVPYLAGLGISHVYLSSFLKARAGSTHGYDIVDHTAINPEIGDMAGLERLHAALDRHQMGIVLDIVPNHMGVGGADNAWWLDVLEWGQDSPYARYFDIDWQPARRELRGKLLLPFLGDHYGAVLERGELVPRFDAAAGTLDLWYWQHRHPFSPKHYPRVLAPAARGLGPGPDGEALAAAVEAFRVLGAGPEARGRAQAAKARLAEVARRPAVAAAIDRALAELAGKVGEPQSFGPLHDLLEAQAWRLSFWRVAADEINYRRFFDINDLAALRMVEEPELFAHAHRLVFDLVGRGIVSGLRIDHVDGLFNPAEYCRQVQAAAQRVLGRPLWLVAEKILAHHEALRRDWPVAGATGYEFANLVTGLFVAQDAEAALSSTYARFIGRDVDVERLVVTCKMMIMSETMASELRVLAVRLGRIAASHWRSRDFTLSVLFAALRAVVAWLPVYRTYVTSRRVTDNDRRYIDWAVGRARRTGGDASVWDFVHGVLDTSILDGVAARYSRRAVVDFAMRFQQVSGPVMAKGFEDTVLYRYNRLLALNEVGGDPTRFGIAPAGFHQANRVRGRSHPHAMLATATHDTKRGEDVRVRIAVLSELPEEWRQHLDRWSTLNALFRKALDGGMAPDANDEIFLYQTLLGAWGGDDLAARLEPVVVKSLREAKRRTSWTAPDEEYEQAVVGFAHRICDSGRRNPFLDDFVAFQRRIAAAGMVNGLVQTLLKLTCPGVPDIYQGCELWQLALVDPDNRRPVDWGSRRAMLGGLAAGPLSGRLEDWTDGAVKQEVIRRTLELRCRRPGLFDQGAYRPLAVRGLRAGHCLAFARQLDEAAVVVAVPLLTARLGSPPLGDAWRGVHVEAPRRVAPGRWRDLFTGAEVEAVVRRGTAVFHAPELFARFPLALLESIPAGGTIPWHAAD
ncbi:MAG: malto-oligosyltrehalose synthase [Actinomycetota bacterium]